MKSLIPLVALCLSAGCGPTAMQDVSEGRSPQTVTLRGSTITATGNEAYGASNREYGIPLSAERLWGAMPTLFEQLQLEPNRVDARNLVLGAENQRVRRVAGQRPSQFVECGQSVSGPFADTQELTLTLLTQINPADDRSTLRVMLNATVRNRNHGGGVTQCRTKGELEDLVYQTVKGITGVP